MSVAAAADALVGGVRVAVGGDGDPVEDAVGRATAACDAVRVLSLADRAAVLDGVAAALAHDPDRLAAALTAEASFLTVRDMALEVERAIDVVTLAAAAARTGFDELVELGGSPRGRATLAVARRVPVGPLLAITAFNGPILIAAHKIAPAIAAGVPVVLKPSPRVPRAALTLAELVIAAGWPADALAVLPVDDATTMRLVADPRLPAISFTGGTAVGWSIKDAAPRKRVHLELGGVGATVVAADADPVAVAEQCVAGGFVRSGQACLSVQRILAEPDAYEPLLDALTPRVAALVAGDPADPRTDVGPLVDERAAARVEQLIADSVAAGARLLAGGGRAGALVEPTLLADVAGSMPVARQEAFGPLLAVTRIERLGDAVAEVAAAGGALNAGVFTDDIDAALDLADALHAGSVVVNGTNAWRVDNMPFGGVGSAGFGREGVRQMIDEITERKVVVVRRRPGRVL